MELREYKALCDRPTVLSRRSLELTVSLLRHYKPQLAMAIQSTVMTPAITKPDGIPISKAADYFEVNLSHQEVDQTIEALTDLNLENAEHETEKGQQLVMMKTLICEWLDLTKALIAQENQTH